jgi:hypothetical protein
VGLAQSEVTLGRVQPEGDSAELVDLAGVVTPNVIKCAHPGPLGPQQPEIHVRDRVPLPGGDNSVSASSTPFS